MDHCLPALPNGEGSALLSDGNDEVRLDDRSEQFHILPAATPELLEEVYRLRFRVYCVENKFEKPNNRHPGLEIDEYDSHSVHSLLIHKPSGIAFGTVRLVLADRGAADRPLPMQRRCAFSVMQNTPNTSMAEISRFAISRHVRRLVAERMRSSVASTDLQCKLSPKVGGMDPLIPVWLMSAILRMSIENNVTHLCGIMEPALIRLLARLGIFFSPIGPLIEHHGRR